MEGVAEFLELLEIDASQIDDEQVALIQDIQSIGRWWHE